MKREGRIHGCNVRVGKRVWGYGAGKVISNNKPTNQSKSTMKHALSPPVSHIVYSEHELPSSKSIGKTKGVFKAKDLDITRNHLMQDWRIYEQGLGAEEEEDNYENYNQGTNALEQWLGEDYHSTEEYGDEDEGTEEQDEEEEVEGGRRRRRKRSIGKRKRTEPVSAIGCP